MFQSYRKTISLLIVGGLFALSFSCCAGLLTGGMLPAPTPALAAQPCHDAATQTTLPQTNACTQALTGIHGQFFAPLALLFFLIVLHLPLLRERFWYYPASAGRQRLRRLIPPENLRNIYTRLLARGILHPKIF